MDINIVKEEDYRANMPKRELECEAIPAVSLVRGCRGIAGHFQFILAKVSAYFRWGRSQASFYR